MERQGSQLEIVCVGLKEGEVSDLTAVNFLILHKARKGITGERGDKNSQGIRKEFEALIFSDFLTGM